MGMGMVEQERKRFAQLALRPSFLKDGFCRSHPCSLLLAEGDKAKGLGKTADLDEKGYQSVAKLKDDHEMYNFIVRLIEEYDCKVEDDGGLQGFVPWFSGTSSVQSFEKLKDALLFAILADGRRWISYKNSDGITGDNASLDLQGYVEVACSKKDDEMEAFIRRLAQAMKIKVIDEDGFHGMLGYHSGSATFQSFDKLRAEIQAAAAAPNSWAEFE